jgi:hypothetical protein
MISASAAHLGSRPNGADQPVQYFPQLGRLVQQTLSMFRSEVVKLLNNHQLGFNLGQRSSRPRREIMEFVGRETGLPFGNVGWNRNGPLFVTGWTDRKVRLVGTLYWSGKRP